jgi:hypothetical protein
VPPAGSKALTEILRPIETKPDFAYLEEVELEDGLYKIEYHTKDGKKQKIEVDPLTGPPARARRGAKRICYLSTCHSFPLSIASSARERVAPTVYFSSKPLLGA